MIQHIPEYNEFRYFFVKEIVHSNYYPKLDTGETVRLLPTTVNSGGCLCVVYSNTSPGEILNDHYLLDINFFLADPNAWRALGEARGWRMRHGEWEFKKRMHMFYEARCCGRSVEQALKLIY